MSERCYYKVEDTNSELFKNASEFLNMEQELIDIQKKAVEEKFLNSHNIEVYVDLHVSVNMKVLFSMIKKI